MKKYIVNIAIIFVFFSGLPSKSNSLDTAFNNFPNFSFHNKPRLYNNSDMKLIWDVDAALCFYFINYRNINYKIPDSTHGGSYWTIFAIGVGVYKPIVRINTTAKWTAGIYIKGGGITTLHGEWQFSVWQLPICAATNLMSKRIMIGGGISYNYYDFKYERIPRLRYTVPPLYFFLQKNFYSKRAETGMGFKLSMTQGINHNNNDGTVSVKGWEYMATFIFSVDREKQ